MPKTLIPFHRGWTTARRPPIGRLFVVVSLFICLLFLYKWNTTTQKQKLNINLVPHRHEVTSRLNITILIVVNHKTDMRQYSFPLSTLKCYADRHKYDLQIVKDDSFPYDCDQKDPMFRRHCVAAMILQRSEWLLFLDADVAVANPDRLIEEYVDPRYDLTFYDRFTSSEIAMGSYLVKNTSWSLDFLRKFADFENSLPNSFHGTDNGAIHMFIVRHLLSELSSEVIPCQLLWNSSNGYHSLFVFEVCIRKLIGNRHSMGKLRIVPKGRGWVRDIWLTNSRISLERDFMVHGTKTKDRVSYPSNMLVGLWRSMTADRFAWMSFLRKDLNSSCRWEYDNRLLTSSDEIERILTFIYIQVDEQYFKITRELANIQYYGS